MRPNDVFSSRSEEAIKMYWECCIALFEKDQTFVNSRKLFCRIIHDDEDTCRLPYSYGDDGYRRYCGMCYSPMFYENGGWMCKLRACSRVIRMINEIPIGKSRDEVLDMAYTLRTKARRDCFSNPSQWASEFLVFLDLAQKNILSEEIGSFAEYINQQVRLAKKEINHENKRNSRNTMQVSF